MEKKAFVLQNKGMNRDTSVSKAGESAAYENHNIRILARDNDTMLSVTGERGNIEVELNETVKGELIGWNVLNSHIILFTHEDESTDRIYRIDYFSDRDENQFESVLLFSGNLGFSIEHPIESVVYFESEEIQKIYWVDGQHVLRFMNFMADDDEVASWIGDNTAFDSNREADFGVSVNIQKDNAGNTRANGVTQYFLTYFNKHGQETNYVWTSDLVYLSPYGRGGAADETNSNSITLKITGLDSSFTNFRVYSIFRSSLDGEVVSYLVHEGETKYGSAIVIDDGSHLIVQDSTRLMFLGSQPVHVGTLTHKDQTLFIGDLSSVGRDYKPIEDAIKDMLFDHSVLKDGIAYMSSCIHFEYSDERTNGASDIPYVVDSGEYAYENQLRFTSSEITTFKGGERYRFGLKFQLKDGTETDSFWIGDADNDKYPVIDDETGTVKRAIAVCKLPSSFVAKLKEWYDSDTLPVRTVQLTIAQATYADRSVKAQGIVNPTMFNVWERYNDRVYSMPSWIARPRNSSYAFRHFEPVHNATLSSGEIECNYWPDEQASPSPYYGYSINGSNISYGNSYNGVSTYDYQKIVYHIYYQSWISTERELQTSAIILRAYRLDDLSSVPIDGNVTLTEEHLSKIKQKGVWTEIYNDHTNFRVVAYNTNTHSASRSDIDVLAKTAWSDLMTEMRKQINSDDVTADLFEEWARIVRRALGSAQWKASRMFSVSTGMNSYNNRVDCIAAARWQAEGTADKSGNYVPSYYQKHLMFVDENVVTLHSPEFENESLDIDSSDVKFRLVGAVKITNGKSDYTIDATHGYLAGENRVDAKFSWKEESGNPAGLISWPLWKERGLVAKMEDDGNGHKVQISKENIEDYTSDDYLWGDKVYYWLHMWSKIGSITGYSPQYDADQDRPDADFNNDYSVLNRKVFANQRHAYKTIYSQPFNFDSIDSIRQVNPFSEQLVRLYIGTGEGKDIRAYSPNIDTAITVPGSFKYRILYSDILPDSESPATSSLAFLCSNEPVSLSYRSGAHAVIALPSVERDVRTVHNYRQTILPYLFDSENMTDSFSLDLTSSGTPAIIPWKSGFEGEVSASSLGNFLYYSVDQQKYSVDGINEGDKYLFVGELYYEKNPLALYGGITESAVANCRFIPAGPRSIISDMGSTATVFGTQGDTYFQRWDCMQTRPFSNDSRDNVIDITSFMVETHVNIDGRTDRQRDISRLASIDTTSFGQVNPVYSQSDDYIVRRDIEENYGTNSYRSTISWTMQKSDMASVDEWSHITLASTLKLDGDKGVCQALRRFQNSIIAFQDKGISEILFNSRTQLTTQDGVPVEIANSGKVDGKRYITNKYGCLNKWSIVEGRDALYFVDNLNKAFCAFSGQGIDPLSTRLGFGVWFRNINSVSSWTPRFNNVVSFYDKIHSDIYVVKNESDGDPCLVYNEDVRAFTSFFDYGNVPMMTNIDDRFVSFRDHELWLQNEGLFCNFFKVQYDAWAQYRVTPSPFSDKVWTNLEYRTDFYRVLDEDGNAIAPESEFTDDAYYQPKETFDYFRFWNEYQTTPEEGEYLPMPEKKFRLWRLQIPRAVKQGRNRYGLDRIRNPWMNILVKKNYTSENNTDLMQMHDMTVIYFE